MSIINRTLQSRSKRSRQVAMTSLMCGAGISLVACDAPPPEQLSQWQDPPAQVEQGKQVAAFAYPTVEACFTANDMSDDECRNAALAAIKDHETAAPRYDARESCEDVYGAGQCVPRNSQSGSYFSPLLTGFVVGQMLNGGFRGTGLYRDQRDGGYYTGYGGKLGSDYRTGRTQIGVRGIDPPDAVRSAPPKMQTRTSVVSRGGFGGRMSSSGYGGGHWGG
jgi:uncharacterized protein YgiB involved in biofilm formation